MAYSLVGTFLSVLATLGRALSASVCILKTVELIHAYLIYGRHCRSKAEIQVNSFQYTAQRRFIYIYDVNKKRCLRSFPLPTEQKTMSSKQFFAHRNKNRKFHWFWSLSRKLTI